MNLMKPILQIMSVSVSPSLLTTDAAETGLFSASSLLASQLLKNCLIWHPDRYPQQTQVLQVEMEKSTGSWPLPSPAGLGDGE